MTNIDIATLIFVFWVSCIGGGFLFTVVVLWTREWMDRRNRMNFLKELRRAQS